MRLIRLLFARHLVPFERKRLLLCAMKEIGLYRKSSRRILVFNYAPVAR